MHAAGRNIKVYVPVEVRFTEEGKMLPENIQWEDGRIYAIDRVLDVRPSAAMRAGGQGDRYTVRVMGRETYLFFEHSLQYGDPMPGRWFVERREENT